MPVSPALLLIRIKRVIAVRRELIDPEHLRIEAGRMRQEGWTVLVLEQAHGSVPLSEFSPAKGEKYLLVVGNEVHGVDQKIVDMCDNVIEIPQCGAKHSLNVSASAAIALWHLFAAIR